MGQVAFLSSSAIGPGHTAPVDREHSRLVSARLENPVLPSFRDNTGCPRLSTAQVSLVLSVELAHLDVG